VISGYNTDVEHNGVVYHVQTEDKGLQTPVILSLVYTGGAILASKRSPYDDLIASGFDQDALVERLQRQHKLICAAINAGRIDELKRMGEPASATHESAVASPAQVVGPTVDEAVDQREAPRTSTASAASERFSVPDLGSQFRTFQDTAAVLKNLDLVITVDSAVAHCAGALGIPVWVLIPYAADWRWLLEREDSPWYPTMRLFRQKEHGNWDEVFDRLLIEAQKGVGSHFRTQMTNSRMTNDERMSNDEARNQAIRH